MSGRGRGRGGGRGRGYGGRGDQPSPAVSRGGGGGRGGGGRSGRGGGGGRDGGRGVPAPRQFESPIPQPTPITSPPPRPEISTGASSSGTVPEASSSTAMIETAVQKLTLTTPPESKVPPSSSKATPIAQRPGFGTVGQKMVVRANHFLVQVADMDLYHYDISITPEVSSKKVCRDIINQLVELYKQSHLGGRILAYDGGKSVYVAGELPFSSKDFLIKLVRKDEPTRKERQFTVSIKFASKPDLHHLQLFLQGRQRDIPQETVQALDVVLRATPSDKYTVVGRSFFHSSFGRPGELGNGVEYWRGYYQSLRPVQMGLSLNIDVSARSFYEPICVADFVAKHFNIRNFSRPLADNDCRKIKKVLKGVKVAIMYGDCARTYKITGLSSEPTNKLMFTLDNEEAQISVAQYFRRKYGIGLECPSLPALQAGNNAKPIYLPMEVCKIVPGQRYTKKLNERQVTEMLRATCQRPADRQASIEKTVVSNKYADDTFVNDFGIQVRQQLCDVDARVLPPPMLNYHSTGKESKVNPRMGQWNMINKKMINGGRVDYWTCVNFSSRLDPALPSEFCNQLVDMCNSKGMVFNRNPVLPIRPAHANQIESVLREIHGQSVKSLGQGKCLQLLIIILPDFMGSYGKIKRICETELGIVSQCCQPRQAQKLNKQYFENVALKINVKVGGRNNVLTDAIQKNIPLVTDRPTIIFGADVTHPQPGEDSSSSIAAVVASMDWPEVTKYRGIVSAQAHREEIIQDLYKTIQDPQRGVVAAGMIRELFIAFRRSTGMKPHRIIFYRDGVSEGQFSQVLLYEMDAIRKACASLEEGYQPPVTFVVVQKRHHTRLFPANRDNTDRSGNILPGTVVDTKICHPTEFDFYLNSHSGIQGTSRPTHYHVLFDENNFSADRMQMLTNNLCYTYARCTRSVSIVPPAYYAHLAAFRARYYMEGDASDSGSMSSGSRNVEIQALPNIKENVKDVMFYC